VTPDGVAGKTGNRDRLSSLTHDGERFLINNRRGQGWESADGKDWRLVEGSTFPANIDAVRSDLIYSFQIYWKATEDLKYSTDGGKTWKSAEIPAPVGITDIVFAAGFPPIQK